MQKPYAHGTKESDLDPGRGEFLFVGARKTGSDVMELAAMAKKTDALQPTSSKTEAHLANGVYWYPKDQNAFGFSPSADISLGSADTKEGNDRLSWHTNGSGGYRVVVIV